MCYVVADIIGTKDKIGGLVGYIYNNGSIANCYYNGHIKGEELVGGLVGY